MLCLLAWQARRPAVGSRLPLAHVCELLDGSTHVKILAATALSPRGLLLRFGSQRRWGDLLLYLV
jgi:hypothetical protein